MDGLKHVENQLDHRAPTSEAQAAHETASVYPATTPRRSCFAPAHGSLVCVAIQTGPKTADELWKLPDDGLRQELVRGELRVMTPAGAEHGRVTATVGILLGAHVRSTGSGVTFGAETGFVLVRSPDTVRAPDAAFVSKEHAEAVGRIVKYWPEAPDFAVEVVSPDDSFREVEEKALGWIRAGSSAVLVLDPSRRTATVYRSPGEARIYSGRDTLDLDHAVPGWRVTVADLFV